jgi:hypothetical protein
MRKTIRPTPDVDDELLDVLDRRIASVLTRLRQIPALRSLTETNYIKHALE